MRGVATTTCLHQSDMAALLRTGIVVGAGLHRRRHIVAPVGVLPPLMMTLTAHHLQCFHLTGRRALAEMRRHSTPPLPRKAAAAVRIALMTLRLQMYTDSMTAAGSTAGLLLCMTSLHTILAATCPQHGTALSCMVGRQEWCLVRGRVNRLFRGVWPTSARRRTGMNWRSRCGRPRRGRQGRNRRRKRLRSGRSGRRWRRGSTLDSPTREVEVGRRSRTTRAMSSLTSTIEKRGTISLRPCQDQTRSEGTWNMLMSLRPATCTNSMRLLQLWLLNPVRTNQSRWEISAATTRICSPVRWRPAPASSARCRRRCRSKSTQRSA
mmetsp:Transcript_19423/g.34625  ORF Transcript_19423/g.34625 Transcript_19423/m.34625 type:complete len:322 (+) Transcript_19423:413-1378(+)